MFGCHDSNDYDDDNDDNDVDDDKSIGSHVNQIFSSLKFMIFVWNLIEIIWNLHIEVYKGI